MGDSRPPTLETGKELDAYRIVRRIGVGGMGSVYEAEHTGLGQRVALKTLNPEVADDDDVRARFVREGQAVARVRHPNIVGVSHVGEADGTTYLVMDLLDGEDLAKRIAREGPLPAEESVEIVLAVTSAIIAAHEAGVIHRDLKPANIFLERTRRGVVPRVLDFGVSKVADRAGEATRTAALLGSPHYMSPEQARSSKNVDWRTDLYAIGVILYECLTGGRPFAGATIFELVYAITHEDPTPPSERVSTFDPALDAIVLKAMCRDASARHSSLREFAMALIPFAPRESQARWRREFEHAHGSLDDSLLTASRVVSSPAQPTTPSVARASWAMAAFALFATLLGVALAWSRAPRRAPDAVRAPLSTTSPEPATRVVSPPVPSPPAPTPRALVEDAGAPVALTPPTPSTRLIRTRGQRVRDAREAAPRAPGPDDDFRVR